MKLLTDYHVHNGTKDGRQSLCKECNIQQRKDWLAARLAGPLAKSTLKELSASGLRYRDRYPGRVAATKALNAAVRRGEIKRPTKCEKCRHDFDQYAETLSGHHEDYGKPLDVVWLCNACHKAHHAEMREKGLEHIYNPVERYGKTLAAPILPPPKLKRVAEKAGCSCEGCYYDTSGIRERVPCTHPDYEKESGDFLSKIGCAENEIIFIQK